MTFRETLNPDGSLRFVQCLDRNERVKEGSFFWPHYLEAKNEGVIHTLADPIQLEAPTPPTLDELKARKIAAIDSKTQQLITSGFTFDGNQFSMSEAAQRNWIGLGAANANGVLSFPLPISTSDEGSYTLADATALLQFLGAYLYYQVDPAAPLASGRALKAQVSAAATEAELDVIVDDRT